MSKPPEKIDGASVLEWAWSGDEAFGSLYYDSGELAAEIYGLAICSYSGDDKIYRFTCVESGKPSRLRLPHNR